MKSAELKIGDRLISKFVTEPGRFNLSTSSIAVFHVLYSHVNQQYICTPGYTTIAARAGCSERTVQKAVKQLQQEGILSRTKVFGSDGNRKGTKYFFSPLIRLYIAGQQESSSVRPKERNSVSQSEAVSTMRRSHHEKRFPPKKESLFR